MKGKLVGAAVLLAVSMGALSGCGMLKTDEPLSASDETMTQACQVMVDEAQNTGHSLGELIPTDLSMINGRELEDVYNVLGQSLDRISQQTKDVKVGEVIGTASSAMQELSPIIYKVSAGDPTALKDAAGPVGRLTTIGVKCSTVVDIG